MLMKIEANVLYTPKDLAEILGFDRRTVQKMLAEGTLPGFKIGRRRWFTLGRDLLAMANNDRDAAADTYEPPTVLASSADIDDPGAEGGQGDAEAN